MPAKEEWIQIIHNLQDSICLAIELCDGKSRFIEDKWERKEGGGGRTRVIEKGDVFEKGGVNTSIVFGEVTEIMRSQLKLDGFSWFACGISLVLHPQNPFVPTVHCNYRMFELYDQEGNIIDQWFGGGTDLTPYYLFDEDVKHFHQTYKNVCDRYNPAFYPSFKKHCDEYFVNKHRNNERRGVGGIFYDYQMPSLEQDVNFWMNFARDCGNAFTEAYLPIVEKRKDAPFTINHKYWQEIRRGRYVEFNLVHDRGTIFGLKTNGRIESILMSLPPTVRFDYNYAPPPATAEHRLVQVCLDPIDWLSDISEDDWAKRSNTC